MVNSVLMLKIKWHMALVARTQACAAWLHMHTPPLGVMPCCNCCVLFALLLQVWRANEMGGWDEEQTLHGHKDWVRDAVWAPNLGMPLNTIASAGQDGQVRLQQAVGC